MTPSTPPPPPEPTDAPTPTRVEGSTGVQIGSGNEQHIHHHYPGRYDGAGGGGTVQSWPVRVGTVPLGADCYQDRPVSLALQEGLERAGTVVLVPAATTVVAGMGGVGKTQIAAQHVQPQWMDRATDLMVWITAVDRDTIVAGYARAAAAIGQAVGEQDLVVAAQALLNWLATTDRRWVIVLDDLQDPHDLNGLWPPHTGTGHTVVTTRRRDAALQRADRRVVEVTPFTADESAAYLRQKLTGAPELREGASELGAELGQLPLALAQAVAYIQDVKISCRDYLHQFRAGHDTTPDVLPDEHQHTVDRTWALSIDRADTLTPSGVARPLLELLAYLDPNGIPTNLPTTTAVLSRLAARVGHLVTVEHAQRALHNLRRLSLADIDSAHPEAGIRVHALVQHAARSTVPAAAEAAIAVTAADALLEIWPKIERNTALAQSLRANATQILQHSQPHLWNPGAHPVLFRIGDSLGNAGLVAAASTHFQKLHQTATHRLGDDHADTLSARHNLARWRGESGDVAGAVAEFERLLADLVRVPGTDHPATLTARSNLAYFRGKAGDVAGAVAEFELLLAERTRVLGADHPDTLTARNNLAYLRGESGDVAGAVAEFELLLAERTRVLGADHPHIVTARGNLARWQGESGDVAGAVAELEQLVSAFERVFGADHPGTLIARGNLSYWRAESGDVAGSFAEFELLVADSARALGADHPDTLTTRLTLARLRAELGDVGGAVAAFEQLVSDFERVLGTDHPHALTARGFLAYWRGESGDMTGAVIEFAQLVSERMRVQGADHPDTLTTRHTLGRCRAELGDVAGAVTEFEQLVADFERVLGPDHPETLMVRGNLADWRADSGEVASAVTEFEQLVADFERVLGADHPSTLVARNNLNYWQSQTRA